MLDYANILRAGQQLVPDLRQQMIQNEALRERRDAIALRNQQMQMQQQQAQQAAQRQSEFERAREQALLSGSPNDLMNLRLRYPEFTKDMKDAFDALEERDRKTALTTAGTIYARGQAGDFAGAAAVLRTRVEADKEAGGADPRDLAILTALEGDDPLQRKAALAEVGIMLSAVEPDKFDSIYGKLNPSDSKTGVQKEYEWRVGKFGQRQADEWLATQDVELVVGEPGAPIYNKRDFAQINQGRGGGPSLAGGQQSPAMASVAPPKTDANGIPASLTREQYQVTVEALGKARTDDWMWRNGVTLQDVVTVRSIQEANKLAPGTRYKTPDGREFVR